MNFIEQAAAMKGKVALVTGAGAGIGKATALALASTGVRVAALTLKQSEADQTAEEIRKAGGEALPLEADVSDAEDFARAVAEVEKRWGRLDIAVANAGVNGVWAPIDEIAEDEWEKVFDINLKGTYLTVKLCLPLLKKNGGAIAIVASVNGTRIFSNSGASAYATTKAGQVAFGRMMALELAKHRIRVNTVCPGAIDTKIDDNTEERDIDKAREPVIFPEGKIPLIEGDAGTADQVAQVIWFLCSPLASHVTGAEIFVDGGESLLQG